MELIGAACGKFDSRGVREDEDRGQGTGDRKEDGMMEATTRRICSLNIQLQK